jgi:fumarate reductase flavoprotein subunit
MGISGHGAGGYLAGNGLLPALGLAFLAAEHVAADRCAAAQ